MQFRTLVLPAPLGPMIPSSSPARSENERPSTAVPPARRRGVAAQAGAHAPALVERLRTAGLDPERVTVQGLTSIPVLRKDTLPAIQRQAMPFGGWLGVPTSGLLRAFRSPGPIFDPEGRDDEYWRFAPALFAAGI